MAKDGMKYFRIAQELNGEHAKILKEEKLHFRANRGSFSLISLSKETPEEGKGGFKSKDRGKKFLDEIKALLSSKIHTKGRGDSRYTREKELQAWIIDYAMNQEYRLPFSEGLTFLTSELAMLDDAGKKIVNDILAIDREGRIVVIELKSSCEMRDKMTLQNQVNRFCVVIDNNRSFFRELVALLAQGRVWNERIRGIVVWPDGAAWPKENGQPRTDWEYGIEEVRYKETLEKAEGKDQRQIYYNEKGEIPFH